MHQHSSVIENLPEPLSMIYLWEGDILPASLEDFPQFSSELEESGYLQTSCLESDRNCVREVSAAFLPCFA